MARMIEAVRIRRNMPWLKCGMEVDVEGTRGRVTGGNAHMNIQVRFPGQRQSHNCHPYWQTTYYQDGRVVADYKTNRT